MYGLDNASGVNVMPKLAPVSSATPLWFTEGGAGLAASYPGQDWFNMIQAELLNILTAGGVKPEKGKLNQLTEAIAKMISNGDFATNDAIKKITSQTIFARAEAIPQNADLNDYTKPGLYFQSSSNPGSNAKNYPAMTACSLEIVPTGNTSVKQVFTDWFDKKTYTRRYNGGNKTWADKWDEDYTKLNPPTPSELGVYSTAQADGRFQSKGDYVDKTNGGEQVLKGSLAVNSAFYVTSDGAGSDLLSLVTWAGAFGFRKRINNTYGGTVEVPYQGGTIALVEQTMGINQSWKNVTSSRSAGVSYTNSSSKPIMVNISGQYKTSGIGNVLVDGVVVTSIGGSINVDISRVAVFIVPAGSKYTIDKDIVVTMWSELS